MKKKIAFVVQRYGLEVHGGAELLARLLAERSRSFYDAEVLTTCALDYSDWANHYPEGTEAVNEVKVRRFTVEKTRDMQMFSKMTVDPADRQAQQIWIDEQGPYCPKLIEYIKKNEAAYDVFIFVTYLYYHTVRGIGAVRDKAVLLPNAHDEPLIYYSIFKDIFTCPRAIAYNTEEEQAFIHELFDNNHVPSDIVGAGIEIPNNTDPVRFKEKYKTDEYILYSGRIDHGKNCPELFEYFIEYKKRNPSGLKLVLTGQEIIEVPEHPDILSLGFVSDEDRTDGMAGAKMLYCRQCMRAYRWSCLNRWHLVFRLL